MPCELMAPPGARPAPPISSWRPTPPPLTPQISPRPLSWPPEPLPRPPMCRVHGEPWVSYLGHPEPHLYSFGPLTLPCIPWTNPHLLPCPPTSSMAGEVPPSPLKFMGLDPSLLPMNTPAPSHHHCQLPPCSIPSSPCLPRLAEPAVSPGPPHPKPSSSRAPPWACSTCTGAPRRAESSGVPGAVGGGPCHPRERRRPLGLASPASALFEREVGDGLSTGPRSSATRWAGPACLSGYGQRKFRLSRAKAYSTEPPPTSPPIAHG